MNVPTRNSICLLLGVFLLNMGACQNTEAPKPVGLSMAELKAQNRAPLDIVSFTSSSGVGDVILGMQIEAADEPENEDPDAADVEAEVTIQRHLLTVSNPSDCEITMFRCAFTYEDENGQSVTSNEATADSSYVADFGGGIAPGATEQLEFRLMVPKGTKAKCRFAEILYKKDGIPSMWKPAEAKISTKESDKSLSEKTE